MTRDTDVVLVRRRIRPGETEAVRDWLVDHADAGATAAMRERGVHAASAFVHSLPDGDVLLCYAEVDDADAFRGRARGDDGGGDGSAGTDGGFPFELPAALLAGDATDATTAPPLFSIVLEPDRR